jgi:hypothetical protein
MRIGSASRTASKEYVFALARTAPAALTSAQRRK